MGRWRTLVLATSACLLLLAGAQRSTWAGQQLQQLRQAGGWHLIGIGAVGSTAPVPAADQLFAAAGSPSWSTADSQLTQLQERLRAEPDGPAAYAHGAQLGNLYIQKARETGDPGYYGKAEAVYQRSLELAPNNAFATVGMGTLQLSRHVFGEALEWGERSLQVAPSSYVVYGVIGDASIELGRYPEAIDAFQKMVDLRPDLSSLSRVSYARELNGDLPGAIKAMQQAIDAGSPHAEGTNWARVQLGNLYFISGDLDNAELQYQQALRALPNYVHGLGGLAKVAAARGNLKQAASRYRQALEVMPWPEYAIALGDVYRALGNPAAAAQQDQLVRVIAQLQRANGVDVDLEMALFEADHAGDRAGDGGAIAAALQNARAQYERRPSVQAANALAWTLYRAGWPGEALPYARESLRLGSKDPLMLFHAGAIAVAAGQPAEGRQYLGAALTQNPQFSVRYAPEARHLLAQLKGAGA